MKIKMLAIAISGVLLVGCNDSNGEAERAGFTVQAFDPAIKGMTASASCDNNISENAVGVTSFDGNITFFNPFIIASPEACAFTFTGNATSKDVSNGKVINTTYKIPKGLAKANVLATASPLTTLIEKQLNGAVYTESAATTVLTDLGLNTLINNNKTTIENLLLNTSTLRKALEADAAEVANFQLLASTTSVLSDVLIHVPTGSVKNIAEATAVLATNISNQFVQNTPNKVVVNENAAKAVVANPVAQTVTDLPPADKPDTTDGTPEVDPGKATGGTGGNTPTGGQDT